jgi:glycosyltransferase involved in cell wall biosynthesis
MTVPPAARILMTTDAVGGVWVYATDLTRALCALGHEVTLIFMGPHPAAEQLSALGSVRGLSIEITDFALEWLDPGGQDIPRAQAGVLAIADRVQPDVIHLNSYREAAFDWPAPVLVVAHSCVWSWWKASRGLAPNEARWDRYAALAGRGLMAADVWLAPTAAFEDAIRTCYRIPTRGRVIHNGVDLPRSDSTKEPFILAAGRLWDEAKNLRALATIASQVDWPVRAAGPTHGPDSGANVPAFDTVQWLGVLSRPQLIGQMQQAGIFVSPALYEPFGLSILEAAVCGCALVLSDIPTLRELWANAALFVEPSDCRALAQALQMLCRDDRLRARLQHTARNRARRYSLGAMARAYHELYCTMKQAPLRVRNVSMPEATVGLQP